MNGPASGNAIAAIASAMVAMRTANKRCAATGEANMRSRSARV
jgi:hypothetical protein